MASSVPASHASDLKPPVVSSEIAPTTPQGPVPPSTSLDIRPLVQETSSAGLNPQVSLTFEPEAPKRTKFRTFTILLALYLTLFVAALDQTIIATAIPTITTSLESASGYTWIGGAYLIANAAAGPIWVKLSDIWGRKPLLLASVVGFFGASVVCAEVCSVRDACRCFVVLTCSLTGKEHADVNHWQVSAPGNVVVADALQLHDDNAILIARKLC